MHAKGIICFESLMEMGRQTRHVVDNKPVVCKPNQLVRMVLGLYLSQDCLMGATETHCAARRGVLAPMCAMELPVASILRLLGRSSCQMVPEPSICAVQAFEMALKAAGADAATSVFCDDSTRNVKAARAAGIFSVLARCLLWLSWGSLVCAVKLHVVSCGVSSAVACQFT